MLISTHNILASGYFVNNLFFKITEGGFRVFNKDWGSMYAYPITGGILAKRHFYAMPKMGASKSFNRLGVIILMKSNAASAHNELKRFFHALLFMLL